MPHSPELRALRSSLQQRGLAETHFGSPPDIAPLKLGAVLILLYPHLDAPHLVLTLRPTHLRRHAGQISLPGGRYEPEDGSLLTTALRETEEELGIPARDMQVWGALDHSIVTVSQYRVTPFVAYTSQRPEFRPNPEEVAEVLEIPLSLLTDASALREEVWILRDEPRRVSFYPWGEHKIWGATARVLGQLAVLLDTGARQPAEL